MNNKFKQKIGSRAQVMHGTSKMTSGGLTIKNLKYNKYGKIVSIKASNAAKKSKNLIKAGYITKKGVFGYIKKGGFGPGVNPSALNPYYGHKKVKNENENRINSLRKILGKSNIKNFYNNLNGIEKNKINLQSKKSIFRKTGISKKNKNYFKNTYFIFNEIKNKNLENIIYDTILFTVWWGKLRDLSWYIYISKYCISQNIKFIIFTNTYNIEILKNINIIADFLSIGENWYLEIIKYTENDNIRKILENPSINHYIWRDILQIIVLYLYSVIFYKKIIFIDYNIDYNKTLLNNINVLNVQNKQNLKLNYYLYKLIHFILKNKFFGSNNFNIELNNNNNNNKYNWAIVFSAPLLSYLDIYNTNIYRISYNFKFGKHKIEKKQIPKIHLEIMSILREDLKLENEIFNNLFR